MADLDALENLLWQVPDKPVETTSAQVKSASQTRSFASGIGSGALQASATPISGPNTTRSTSPTSSRSSARIPTPISFNTSLLGAAIASATTTSVAIPNTTLDDGLADDSNIAGDTALRFISLIVLAAAAIVLLAYLVCRKRRKASKAMKENRSVTALRRDVELGRWRIPLFRHAGIGQVSHAREDLPQYEGKLPAYPEMAQVRQVRVESIRDGSIYSSRITSDSSGLTDATIERTWSGAHSMEAVALSGVQHSDTDSMASR